MKEFKDWIKKFWLEDNIMALEKTIIKRRNHVKKEFNDLNKSTQRILMGLMTKNGEKKMN